MSRILYLLVAGIILQGCATTGIAWQHPTASPEQYYSDRSTCKLMSSHELDELYIPVQHSFNTGITGEFIQNTPSGTINLYEQEQAFQECMHSKGYSPSSEPAPAKQLSE
ncbi:hypothetical protein [Oceanospirillum sediminis]|uniref:Lipoprotein n=1 Tax=Oceanospirillum sediminis TaxID=2760088 RepID=A0A839IM85_9GAMM|nr:hypothetical protein [Oceanospirillum sediminis]MBB1486068.1 hypothetical protein [Oceanospirillum sediminis]